MSRRMHNLFSRKTSTPLINVLIEVHKCVKFFVQPLPYTKTLKFVEVSFLVIVYAKDSFAGAGSRLISLLD